MITYLFHAVLSLQNNIVPEGGFFPGIVFPVFAGGAIFSVRIVARKRFFLSFYESLLLKGKFVSVQSMRNCHYFMFLNLLDNLA